MGAVNRHERRRYEAEARKNNAVLKRAGFKTLSLLVTERTANGSPKKLELIDEENLAADNPSDEIIIVFWDGATHKMVVEDEV
jgi:hypothetical protein